MRILNAKAVAVVFLLCALPLVRIVAQSACDAGSSCASCGEVQMNAAPLPSDAPSVAPYANYIATVDYASRRCGYFSGFYLGVAYGIGNINYHLKIDGLGPPPYLDNDARTYLTTIFNAGFNLVLDHFLLGIEGGYDYRSRNNPISFIDTQDFLETDLDVPFLNMAFVTSEPGRVRFDISSRQAYTVDILPGFVFSQFAGYLRLGYEQTHYSFNERFSFPSMVLNTGTGTLFIDDTAFSFSKKNSSNGYRVGVGFAIAANQHISFHLNYIHTFYDKIDYPLDLTAVAAEAPIIIPGPGTPVTPTLTLLSPANIEPQRDEINFGVKFRF